MTPKRFKSKIDRWLLFLLVAVMVFEVVIMSIAATQVNSSVEATVLIVAALAIVKWKPRAAPCRRRHCRWTGYESTTASAASWFHRRTGRAF
jgi:membrane protein YdbS with pleckstrin-like domain